MGCVCHFKIIPIFFSFLISFPVLFLLLRFFFFGVLFTTSLLIGASTVHAYSGLDELFIAGLCHYVFPSSIHFVSVDAGFVGTIVNVRQSWMWSKRWKKDKEEDFFRFCVDGHICYVTVAAKIKKKKTLFDDCCWMNHLFLAPGGDPSVSCNPATLLTQTEKTHLCESHSRNPKTRWQWKRLSFFFFISSLHLSGSKNAEELERGAVD